MSKTKIVILFFAFLKLIFHLVTSSNYGLHRDEYLYFEQGKHMAWGFYEVPPFTPFIGMLANIFDGSVFMIRLFPALTGVLIIILACKLVKDLGGGMFATIATGLSLTLSTSLLATNSLFQPVSFNQLFWFLLAFSIVKIIINQDKKNYYFFGVLVGLALLTKYSASFYLIGLLVGILLTKERTLLNSKYFFIAILASILLFSPNILWQYNHNFPVINHMNELRETQLVHMDWLLFLKSQITTHKGFTLMWIFGLVGLFTIEKIKPFRSLGIAFIVTILLIGILHGKSYYTLGAFLILFPFGGIALEHFVKSNMKKALIMATMFIITIPFYPISTLMLNVDNLQSYSRYLDEKFGINYMLRWEDGKYRILPQDIADMFGWEELAQLVAKKYHSLPNTQKEKCMIFAGSYGEASSLNYYSKKYNYPEVQSFNGSFLYWADENYKFDNIIMVDDHLRDSSSWYNNMVLVDSIHNPIAREAGYIFHQWNPQIDVIKEWNRLVLEERH